MFVVGHQVRPQPSIGPKHCAGFAQRTEGRPSRVMIRHANETVQTAFPVAQKPRALDAGTFVGDLRLRVVDDDGAYVVPTAALLSVNTIPAQSAPLTISAEALPVSENIAEGKSKMC